MLLTFASNNNNKNNNKNRHCSSSSFILNKSKNKHNNNNNCLTSMVCLCGRVSCCHSKVKTITTTTTTTAAAASPTVAATSPTSTPSPSTTNTIITSSRTAKLETTTMKTSAAVTSSSTQDNSNYMHCANSTCNTHLCYNCGSCSEQTISNSFSTKTSNSFRKCIFNINNNLDKLIKFAIVLIFFTCCDSAQATLRDVNLYIEPPAVRRSQSVTLYCHYTIEGAPLYSVKFYRGQLEFFRYTPGEYPNTKVFHFPGIKVDETVSNATQVVIRNVNFALSGNFSCEVTADAPLFSTATSYAQMQVVEFPEKRPQLITEQARYEPGDILRANCSIPPSRPKTELRFTINNLPVSSEETQHIRTVDNLFASRLSLKLQLQAVHFTAAGGAIAASSNSHKINALNGGAGGYGVNGDGAGAGSITSSYASSAGNGGSLLLRCTAQIGDLYQEYKEIELGTPQKDPVPARVTSSGGGLRGFLETYFGPTSAATSIYFERIHYFTALSILTSVLMLYQAR